MKKVLSTLIILATAAFFAAKADVELSDQSSVVRNLDLFNTIYKELNTFYVDTIDASKTIENAINAMLDDIDPYTEYIPARDREDFQVIATGEYGGIGSYIMKRNNGVYISEPYKGSPAAKAGLRPGDRIIMINGDSIAGLTQDQVSNKLKGQANTSLTVTVARPYCDDSIKTIHITREKIIINPVTYYGVTRESIGYIKLSTFNESSAEQVKTALLALKANPDVKQIVLDLRGNGGGLLESAVQIVGMFVPKGTQVLQTRGRTIQTLRTYKTTENPVDEKIPLAVLIDGGSASAAEITAGALQDLDRAVVIGSRSYGKGLVQTTRPLPYDGTLKVTIAKYYIPSGRLIQEYDYAKRNADGTVAHVVDSVSQTFYTAHGREVKEGGGITPDIKVDYPDASRIVYNIVRDNWAFDFATRYASTHESIPEPSKFVITDTIFNEFKAFINPEKFQYDKVCETGLNELKKVAEREGYMNDSTAAQFAKLEQLLKHDLDHDLDAHRKEISVYLAEEIVKRYYYATGVDENALLTDETMDRAAEMFAKQGEYERILNLVNNKGKKRK